MLSKTRFLLSIEHDALLEFRRTLIKYRLNPQKFFLFIVRKTITNDSNFLQLLEEASTETSNHNATNKRLKHLDADELYSMIEQGDSDRVTSKQGDNNEKNSTNHKGNESVAVNTQFN
jgi:hypothetical protein